MIRVLQFASCINRHDFIDVIVQHADASRFTVGVCVASEECNISNPLFSDRTPRWVLGKWPARRNLVPAAWRLARILRQWRADILHTHHFDEAIIGYLATRLHRRTRLVVGRHYSDAVHLLLSKGKREALLRLEACVHKAATRIIVPSTYICDLLVNRQGVAADRVAVIPYGFPREKYPSPSADEVQATRRTLGLDGTLAFGIFGRVDGQKGHFDLVEAIASIYFSNSHVRLVVVGDGPEYSDLCERVRMLGLEKVVLLLGWRRDALAIMAAVDAVVHPSLQEAFSQVMVEAMWMGKPLIISDVSGATDIIRDGENGLLVKKGNRQSLRDAVSRLVKDEQLRTRLAVAGQRSVQSSLSVERIVPKYEQVYHHAMEGNWR